MSSVFTRSAELMQRYREQHGQILVAYSGGKDSLCCLDLAVKTFGAGNVKCYYLYFVRGLEHIEAQLDFARQRYGVEVLQYPHFSAIACMREGIYCKIHHSLSDLPDLGLFDMAGFAMADTGYTLAALGWKDADGGKRRHIMRTLLQTRKDVCFPISEWNKFEVLSYLRVNKIPLPPSSGRTTTGVGMLSEELCWLYDTFPRDFEKLCRWFPFARAAIKRRQWYGIGGY